MHIVTILLHSEPSCSSCEKICALSAYIVLMELMMTDDEHKIPEGELALQTIAMPGDANGNGDIFGGWVVSQMDLAAGVTARKRARGRVATVAIDAMTFLKPMKVGDIIGCYTTIEHVGRSSIRIAVEVWKTDDFSSLQMKLTEGIFTFVAIDDQGKSRSVPSAVAS